MRLIKSSLRRSVLVVPALLLMTACGASSDDASTSSTGSLSPPSIAEIPGAPEVGELADGGSGGSAVKDSASYDAGTSSTDVINVQERAVISRGQVSLETDDLDQTRFELQKLLDGWRGRISQEEASADEDGRTERQRVEIRVPSDKFGSAMDAISELGTLVDRSRSSEDVTTQVIDTETRVRSQKLSLARIQALLAKASDINQIIAIESQLSRRQAELDSLEQQQKYLADQTSESTISVYLQRTDTADDNSNDDKDGFVNGLKDGWGALQDSTTAILQGLGAVLPFAALIALVAVPVLAIRRRRSPTS